ncbi:MAG: hypothetical protein CMN60_20380 [Sphingobium sp.]|nr:hypothetical protein [Sphingobium sp.]|tara:strand:+ start:4553 stop:5158 length:606 start_codon:yes stop_codon:yes gene_type:complete
MSKRDVINEMIKDRAAYIEGKTPVRIAGLESIHAVVYISDDPENKKYQAAMFQGKRATPDAFFAYDSAEVRDARINDWVKPLAERVARKEAKKLETRAKRMKPLGISKGEVFYTAEEGPATFYEVTGLKGPTGIKLRRIKSEKISPNTFVPVPGNFDGDEMIYNVETRKLTAQVNGQTAQRLNSTGTGKSRAFDSVYTANA